MAVAFFFAGGVGGVRKLGLALCLSLFVTIGQAAVPPPPARPDTSGLTPQQRQEVTKKWRQDYQAWEQSLTPEQKKELAEQRAEEQRKGKEAMARMRRLPLPEDNYDWRAEAVKRNVPAEAVEQLARDHVAYGPSVKQIFEPYIGGPVFITSDSLLNCFHVLFDDTLFAFEQVNREGLRDDLEKAWQSLEEQTAGHADPALVAAKRHAQLALAPALTLLGSSVTPSDETTRGLAEAELAKIRAADSVALPDWLAPATNAYQAIDYRRFKPVGFYTRTPELSDYFRAVRWLQTVPFRSDHDTEFTAIGLLGNAAGVMVPTSTALFRLLAGPAERSSLADAGYDFQGFTRQFLQAPDPSGVVQNFRTKILRDIERHGARGAMSATENQKPEKDLEYRLLPAAVLIEVPLFEQTTAPILPSRFWPSGLEIAALLGSSYAREHLPADGKEKVLAAIAEYRANLDHPPYRPREMESVYSRYLHAIEALFAPMDAAVPDVFRGRAWAQKSCQTAVAGWAQMRHAFTLQAKANETFFGLTISPPGFVEPNPQFFSRMADLAEFTDLQLANAQVYEKVPLFEIADRSRRPSGLAGYNLRTRWVRFTQLCRHLQALAEKQLRSPDWTPEEEAFLKSYGAELAHVMGYQSNSYSKPHDDAPRWAEVYSRPDAGKLLAVAVGRPRKFYILYPWKGIEVLCTGAVMPYYEYVTDRRLTDEEWKAVLDTPQAPKPPEWAPAVR